MVASLGLAVDVPPFSGSGWKPSFEKRFCDISNVGWRGRGKKNVNQPRVEESIRGSTDVQSIALLGGLKGTVLWISRLITPKKGSVIVNGWQKMNGFRHSQSELMGERMNEGKRRQT